MAENDLIGIYEIAELANVSASAVTNWRKRFTDFPPALAELKSGPVLERAKSNSGSRDVNPRALPKSNFSTINWPALVVTRRRFEKR